MKDLYDALASIKRPQDITADRFRALNLKVESDVPASRIVRHDDTSSVPPLAWEDKSGEQGYGQTPLMNNETRYPNKERYEALRNELLLDNDDAFREVTRMSPREGRQRVRVAQTRKFWIGFERMAQYWDTSLDHYFERPPPEATPKAEKGDEMQTDDSAQASEKQDTAMDIDNQTNAQTKGNSPSSPKPQRPSVTMYTGRRTGAGYEMPEDIREETVRAFAEMAAWCFGCQVSVPTLPPRLAVKTLLFPIRMSFEAARSPKNRQLARSGILEGPVFVGQCRPETIFRSDEEQPGTGIGEVCDLFREVGAMLLGAQERAREGTSEVRPGEGKWWTTVPRWGGAPNDGTVESVNGDDDTHSHSEKEKPAKWSKFDHPFLARRPSRKLSNTEKWKIVHPGPSLWDKRMRYMQIGKPKESPFDDVRTTHTDYE